MQIYLAGKVPKGDKEAETFHDWRKEYTAVLFRIFPKASFVDPHDLKLDEIVSFTVHDNTRSIGVMEKIGMVRDEDGDFDYPALRKGHPLGSFVLYRSKK